MGQEMPGLGFRYVGSDRLPMRLSEFDVELYFALTDSDVAAINERFRHDRRAGAAVQLVFLRASGHSLGQVSTLPRQLLHYIGQRLGLPTPTIAKAERDTLIRQLADAQQELTEGQAAQEELRAELGMAVRRAERAYAEATATRRLVSPRRGAPVTRTKFKPGPA